jgi:hypothetical protein
MSNTLTASIQTLINQHITGFLEKLSERFQVPIGELQTIWEEEQGQPSSSSSSKASESNVAEPDVAGKKASSAEPDEKQETESTATDSTVDKKKSKDTKNCLHILTRGRNKGQACGKKPVEGYTHCKKHQKYGKKTTNSSEERHVLREGPDGTYVHRATGLLFKISDTEKIVVGELSQDGTQLAPLTDKGIQQAKKHNFKYRKSVTFQEEVDQVLNASDQQDDILSVLERLQLKEESSGTGQKPKTPQEDDEEVVSEDEEISFKDIDGSGSEEEGNGFDTLEPISEEM